MNKISIGVIGAGTMGAGIAQVAAAAGHRVYLTDSHPATLSQAKESHHKTYKTLIEKGKVSKEIAEEILTRINYTEGHAMLENAGLVIEAIIENLEVKQQLFSGLEAMVPDDCILATNTSSLSIASIASACRKPERILGIHFFNPAPLMPLVEIIPSLTTGLSLVSEVCKLISGWGKVTVVAKDTPGFIVNRIARPFYSESIRIYEEGIAGFASIDRALKETGGFKMGPFELMDLIGNDVNYKVTETVWEQFFYDARYRPSLTQKRLFEAKFFGRKTGRGYFDYTGGIKIPETVISQEIAEEIFNRVFAMLVNEAAEALYLNVATRDDIDLAMTKGVNYPKGLLKWADEAGLPGILATLDTLRDEYREERYRPCVLLRKMVKEGRKFYQ